MTRLGLALAVVASVCIITGNLVSFIGAGTCVINAMQDGNALLSPAPLAQQSFDRARLRELAPRDRERGRVGLLAAPDEPRGSSRPHLGERGDGIAATVQHAADAGRRDQRQ